MNYRILKNGTMITESAFQTLLEDHRKKNPGATEEELLTLLNKQKEIKTVLTFPGERDLELKKVPTQKKKKVPAKKVGRIS